MAQTLCIKCGSDLKASSYCQLCQEPLIFACTSCDYSTEEKVHADCRNAEVLAKTASTIEVGTAEDAATITKTPRTITGNQEESILDKPKQETVKAELRSAQFYMTAKQDNNKNNSSVNQFAAGTALWQNLMTYWLNAYEEFFKNAPKMTEEWYNIFWKHWVNWMAQQQRQNRD